MVLASIQTGQAVTSPLTGLGLTIPVLAAPMAGGPTTAALVIAAADAGGLGMLAGGYLTAADLREQLLTVRSKTDRFGVNLFAPSPVPVDRDHYRSYRDAISRAADRYGVQLPVDPVEDDDHWQDKLDLLLAEPVPVVSFTFGIPDRAVLAALRAAGSLLVQTVTSAAEAQLAATAGVDALAVQAIVAGGHSGVLRPDRLPADKPLADLLAEIGHAVQLPLIAAGGLASPADVTAARQAGAVAVMVGTALLRSDESGASAAHRDALADPNRGDPVLTRAFTGRPARGLRNRFIDEYEQLAPLGYPALHHLTRPLRKASAAAADPEWVNLWAGNGYREATSEPAAAILRRLASEL